MSFPGKNIKLFALLTFMAAVWAAGCREQRRQVESGLSRIGNCGVLYKGVETKEEPVAPSEKEQKKKEVAERLDTAGLLYTGKVVVDEASRMLEPPKTIAECAGGGMGYVIAKEPPEIEFAVVPVQPMFLGESPVKSKSDTSNTPGPWSSWSQANFDTRSGKFYYPLEIVENMMPTFYWLSTTLRQKRCGALPR